MVPNAGSRLPGTRARPPERELAHAIAKALRAELGGSRRATKTVMGWADVSDRTARAWLQGGACPGSVHMLALSSHCRPVLAVMLDFSGNGVAAISLNIFAVEKALEEALAAVKQVSARS